MGVSRPTAQLPRQQSASSGYRPRESAEAPRRPCSFSQFQLLPGLATGCELPSAWGLCAKGSHPLLRRLEAPRHSSPSLRGHPNGDHDDFFSFWVELAKSESLSSQPEVGWLEAEKVPDEQIHCEPGKP